METLLDGQHIGEGSALNVIENDTFQVKLKF